MSTESIPKLRTLGVIAAALREPVHRVEYIARTRPHIRPAAVAGRLRLYDREALAQIRYELNVIDARRNGRMGGDHE